MNKKLEKLATRYSIITSQLREESIKHLHKILSKNNNEIEWNYNDLYEFVTVSYDGGNHPEYASNVYSTVYGVKLEDGDIYLNTEDCSKYSIDGVNAIELFEICNFLDTYKKEVGIK